MLSCELRYIVSATVALYSYCAEVFARLHVVVVSYGTDVQLYLSAAAAMNISASILQ